MRERNVPPTDYGVELARRATEIVTHDL